ncbi:unnamed protein product (macronuclear) [Paramecium tetraurelia]|uniref:Altered inheritance of mitochondria protein 24, mitochondrial n=1 Tax=Paramecium tetraurelia TaxID=5888 RepID=A0BJI4_PARTE|nr:uncharacterized protein GSPATT00029329001 [Paramecium tetraurelia]CAK58701.1 unnamed protein product [Paramecium tetraurelia]|eukprot:XP_001426099.1 hypothetical protein (macronuclear) [Paramecium tetraurelia strain d4-2]
MWFGFKKQNDTQNVQQAQQFPAYRHKAAHQQGGLNLSFGEENSETQKVAASVFKQLSGKLITGNFGSLMQISKPIAMSLDMSFLHGVALGHTFGNLLERCSQLSPMEQIKYISAYQISGLHCNGEITKMKSPLDPLVGETIQLVKEDGTQFFAEQTSFDPPICFYYIQGNNYKIYGDDRLEIQVHKTVNSLTGVQNGRQTIIFNNGAVYKCAQRPTMEITGLVMGDRLLNWQGKMVIEGPGVKSVITFNYNAEGMMSKITSFFKSQEQAKIFDIVEVDIFEVQTDENGNKTETLLQQGIGSWLEGLLFGEEKLWQIDEEKKPWISPQEVLESDTTKRDDLIFMKSQKMEDAQKAKLQLEEQNFKDLDNRRKKQ